MTEQRPSGSPPDDGLVFGPYRILELIGAGGMAEVYRARGPGPDGEASRVVIKRVKPKYAGNEAFEQMFRDEARVSVRLHHRNLVQVFDHGDVDGHPYMAMEYIDGLHLQGAHVRHAQLLRKPLPVGACVLIARDMLRGLHYAHELRDEQGVPLGLIHRDVNLVNVMIRRDGRVKVLDFGIVKAADGVRSLETVGSVLKGKFAYMSPEQAEGKVLDPRSDVFSASVVLHELVTGRRLFFGGDDLVILRKVRQADIPDPRSYRPDVPEALVAVILKGLARDREARYGSAAEMADALDAVVQKEQMAADALETLMASLMPPKDPASEAMRERRRKVTMLAWRSGVQEVEAPASRSAAGVLDLATAPASTVPAKRSSSPVKGASSPVKGATGMVKGLPESLVEQMEPPTSEGPTAAASLDLRAAPILTQPRWLVPDGVEMEPVLGEQDATVITVSGAASEATLILEDADSWMDGGMEIDGDGEGGPGAAQARSSDASARLERAPEQGGDAGAGAGAGRSALWLLLTALLLGGALVLWITVLR